MHSVKKESDKKKYGCCSAKILLLTARREVCIHRGIRSCISVPTHHKTLYPWPNQHASLTPCGPVQSLHLVHVRRAGGDIPLRSLCHAPEWRVVTKYEQSQIRNSSHSSDPILICCNFWCMHVTAAGQCSCACWSSREIAVPAVYPIWQAPQST